MEKVGNFQSMSNMVQINTTNGNANITNRVSDTRCNIFSRDIRSESRQQNYPATLRDFAHSRDVKCVQKIIVGFHVLALSGHNTPGFIFLRGREANHV
jgi:hypothetical protein